VAARHKDLSDLACPFRLGYAGEGVVGVVGLLERDLEAFAVLDQDRIVVIEHLAIQHLLLLELIALHHRPLRRLHAEAFA
jgi:hypothetical protein